MQQTAQAEIKREVSKTQRDYYKVLLVGSSGKGKTMSFRNMNPANTGFINIEDKPLPFKNNFKYHSRPKTVAETKAILMEYSKNPEITTIVIDSFSAYVEILLAEARGKFKGFDIWNNYNEETTKFLNFIKGIQKEVYITAHYEILGIEGNQEKRVKIKGKEYEGLIEKEFTVVLYADNKFNDKGLPEYYFNTVQEGTSAKCPPDLLGRDVIKITNDCNEINNAIIEFTK
jgi:hypothetical protein